MRERKGDIPLLARHYLQMFAAEMGREAPQLGSEILRELSTYSFPGNVRELKNIIERALIESDGRSTCTSSRRCRRRPTSLVATDIPLNLAEGKLWLIRRALAKAGGNMSEAARLLGTHRNRIYRALAEQEHA